MKLKYAEITVATLLLLISIYALVGTAHYYTYERYAGNPANARNFATHHLQFSFVTNYLLPELIGIFTYYFSFLWFACGLPDKYLKQRAWLPFLLTTILGLLSAWLLFGFKIYLTDLYDEHILWNSFYGRANQAMLLYTALLAYQVVKQSLLFIFNKARNTRLDSPVKLETICFLVGWSIIITGCLILKVYWGWQVFYCTILPCGFITYVAIQYGIIPSLWDGRKDKTTFWLTLIAVTFAVNLPFNGYFSYRSAYEVWSRLVLFILAWVTQLCVIVPLSFYIFYRRKSISAEITGLQTGLSQKDADLLYLRSQIDPHFLFNALNTLYGVALKEHAESTADGVQKLGEMMRFMLHENNQQYISLEHEIQNLGNYISLQKLRLTESQNTDIKVSLHDTASGLKIAPVLLVPFVENAFKHGISLRSGSWVSVNLYLAGSDLHFEVNNSIHADKKSDMDDRPSGIGLENVKKRLQLIYPSKHQLHINKTTEQFSIDLTIDLS